ncbi:beta-lactam antibiotic acylase [Ureibacillus massiliensis 4400831 = CIP 108448 = CCUG 49529]|uniref:Beta-lactam antibiotic acylase n=2 Tax=cellular organisms TaxID=131567 RepID=A0A0A3J478_9BACL|nr:penicillin acylase family protein [Ureibacillus massiliensis]KGR91809.1 beta-lactam antibiotic acylase [Ureibacillus massiliensis 4400831 = CIP 108448 = CCUG 49529]
MSTEAIKKKKPKRIIDWIIWAVGILIILGGLIVVGIHFYVASSLPKIEGDVVVEILDEDVTVTRDGHGVPHISAKTEADLYRAQGYVQAQDRLFQMDLARRQASGTLAEVVGETAIESDKLFRTFSLRNAAEKSWETYDDETKQILEWFAEGVNAYINEGKLTYEFALLGYKPEEWTPIDSLTIGKYMAYDLGGTWKLQAFNHWAMQNLTEEEAKELLVKYPEGAPSIIEANLNNSVKVAGEFNTELLPNEFNGSNNWVISGEKTETGKPLLANDPHLSLGTPSIWYEMHLQSPEQNVSGVIFAGVPGIILGHNESIAWGVTNVGPDVQDLYIEIPNPENPTQFKYDGKWEDAEVRNEPIKVKNGETIDFEVVVTRHGPVISDYMFGEETPDAVFSMQWTALEPTHEFRAILGFNKATNWDEFEEALEDFKAPAQNFVFASTDGTIAYKAVGNIPIRKSGEGELPVPGDSSEYGWEGYIPFDELPSVINPEEGYIVTANNEVIGEEYPYHIANYWAPPYRYERIVELIESVDGSETKLTSNDMKAIQSDKKNFYAEEFLPHILETLKKMDTEGKYEEIITLLEEWEMFDNKDEAAPLVFNLLMDNVQKTLYDGKLPEDIYELMPAKYQVTDQLLRDAYAGNPGVWVTEAGGIDQVIFDSFEITITDIKSKYGTKASKWTWGSYNKLTFDHPLSAASDFLAQYINPSKQSVGGSRITVQAAGNDGQGNVNHGASWRFVVDLNDLSHSFQLVAPGQSGHVKSKWYDDQSADWVYGRYHQTNIDGNLIKTYELILKSQ